MDYFRMSIAVAILLAILVENSNSVPVKRKGGKDEGKGKGKESCKGKEKPPKKNKADDSMVMCTDINIITRRWGNENSWTFGDCASAQQYRSHDTYTETCCQQG